jgi:hypothetical protein
MPDLIDTVLHSEGPPKAKPDRSRGRRPFVARSSTRHRSAEPISAVPALRRLAAALGRQAALIVGRGRAYRGRADADPFPAHVAGPVVGPERRLRPKHAAPIVGEETALVRPYLIAHERRAAERSARAGRRTLLVEPTFSLDTAGVR